MSSMRKQMEDGELMKHGKRHSKQKKKHSRSRSRKKSHRQNDKNKDKKKDKKKDSHRHEPKKSDYDKSIMEENLLLDKFVLQDEDHLLQQKRKERENMLSRYRVEEAPLTQNSGTDTQEESQDVKLSVIQNNNESTKQEVDVTRQNYLKMLESQRDQEIIQEGSFALEEKKVEDKVEKKKEPFDMFEDDVDESNNKDSREISQPVSQEARPLQGAYEADDENRYYRATVGEILNKDYRVTVSKSGKGVFSNVVKAQNTQSGMEVAVKILRSEEIYLRSGERERQILLKLNEADKHDNKHIVRMLDQFEHRKHLCLVFESMDGNLREYLRSHGKGSGLNLDTVKVLATQLFISLAFLRKNKIIHADIKPDNILISYDHKKIKLCDFGTAFGVEECSLVDYLVSRYYRAPEVIIGYPYDTQLDVWSTACTLYEFYTGKFLFTGINNNDMLKQQLQTIGKFSLKILKKGSFISKYFDQNFTFLSKETDPVTRTIYYKPILLGEKPTRSLLQLLKVKEGTLNAQDQKKLLQFKDFLEKCMQLDPKNRMTPEEALLHPFLNTQEPQVQKKK